MLPADDLQASPPVFGPARRMGVASAEESDLVQQAFAGRVTSLLFDDMLAVAVHGVATQASRLDCITIALAQPSRRRIKVVLTGSVDLVGPSCAKASLVSEHHCSGHDWRFERSAPWPDGSLATRNERFKLSLTLPRSSHPRSTVPLLMWIDAQALAPASEAMICIDALDVQAC